MQRFIRFLAPVMLSIVFVVAGVRAQACQDIIFDPVQPHADRAQAVVLARVVSGRLMRLEELGIACDDKGEPVRCEVLEIEIDVSAVFKGDGLPNRTVYAPAIPYCSEPIILGLDYIFFLADFGGLIGATDASFGRGHPEWLSRISALQSWKADQAGSKNQN